MFIWKLVVHIIGCKFKSSGFVTFSKHFVVSSKIETGLSVFKLFRTYKLKDGAILISALQCGLAGIRIHPSHTYTHAQRTGYLCSRAHFYQMYPIRMSGRKVNILPRVFHSVSVQLTIRVNPQEAIRRQLIFCVVLIILIVITSVIINTYRKCMFSEGSQVNSDAS